MPDSCFLQLIPLDPFVGEMKNELQPEDIRVFKIPTTRIVGILCCSLFIVAIAPECIVSNDAFIVVVAVLLFIISIIALVGCVVGLFTTRLDLVLCPDGFRFGTVRKQYYYRWSDIRHFGVAWHTRYRVCFTFQSHYPGESSVRKVNQRWMGFDRFLPENYGMDPKHLAQIMETWR